MSTPRHPSARIADDSVRDPRANDGDAGDCYQRNKPDWFFRVLVTALFVVAAWLLAMPWVPAIATCTLQRFHLRTGSFVTWAIQQPIPPMYSFANTTQVRTVPPNATQKQPDVRSEPVDGLITSERELPAGVLAGRTINHFPTREFTFANARVRYLRERTRKWFVLRSSYRGQTVHSVYRLNPAADGGWTVRLVQEDPSMGENES